MNNPKASANNIWVKGNTHTHTNLSDGDAPPEAVIEWYRSHGYQFLVLTDHNCLTDPAAYSDAMRDDFILIPGEELTTIADGDPVHVNAFGISEELKEYWGKDKLDTIQGNVDIARSAGLQCINHPNFCYAFDHRELLQIDSYNLFEVYNAHPDCNNSGNAAHLPVEQIWDILLSAGKTVYAVASDDAHNYHDFQPHHANPGRAWIMVRVNKLDQAAVLESIRTGNFYASTGVELSELSYEANSLHISVKPTPNISYRIRFIGLHGQILQETNAAEATYQLTGKPAEAYIRAKVIASDGAVAWIQPVRRA